MTLKQRSASVQQLPLRCRPKIPSGPYLYPNVLIPIHSTHISILINTIPSTYSTTTLPLSKNSERPTKAPASSSQTPPSAPYTPCPPAPPPPPPSPSLELLLVLVCQLGSANSFFVSKDQKRQPTLDGRPSLTIPLPTHKRAILPNNYPRDLVQDTRARAHVAGG